MAEAFQSVGVSPTIKVTAFNQEAQYPAEANGTGVGEWQPVGLPIELAKA